MKRILGLTAAIALGLPLAAQADDLYNTMGMVGAGSYDIGNGNAIAGGGVFGDTFDLQLADDFVVPAGGFTIQELEQASVTILGQAPADMAIRIYADNGGVPDEAAYYEALAVADLGLSVTKTDFVDNNFGFAGVTLTVTGLNLNLPAGTYWIDLQPIDVSDTADWYYQLVDFDSANGAISHLRDGESGYPGGYGLTDWAPNEAGDSAMRISGIPEPTTMVLLALGALGLIRRR